MKRILHVYPQLNCGGTEMVFYNLIKFGDRQNHSYEILIQRHGENEYAFTELNVPIHLIPFDSADNYYHTLVDFLKKERFDVIHAHMDTELPLVLKAAKEAGIKCRVAHSHNARIDIPRILWPLRHFRHHPYEKYSTHLFGCSRLALKWLFPTQWRNGHVINNGIDLDTFRFDPVARRKYRTGNGISDTTKVLINVGRCTSQKNQKFILDIAEERRIEDELYIIIGAGPLFETLRKDKESRNLKNVLLLGKRDDVAQWLCAADVFLFPSVYEGLGIVAIEAEASGLRVLATDTIPEEADMHMGNFCRIALNDKTKWHETISLPANGEDLRMKLSDTALSSDYNIHNVARKVESLYKAH